MQQMPKGQRKQYGQFFTPVESAEFMAGLFDIDFEKPSLSILDAGAGTGLLSVALVCRLRSCGYKGRLRLTCYETDVNVLPVLSDNLRAVKSHFGADYDILTDNYITSQPFGEELFRGNSGGRYDMVIGNPPYKKLPKDAPEASAMPSICHGAPNLYFLFEAMGIHNLKDNGELVYIIPRSWTSGAYFGKFRDYLHAHCAIMHMHLFGSRGKVFGLEPVLQETMIIKLKKTAVRPENVTMSFSETSDFHRWTSLQVPYGTAVGGNGYVYLVTTPKEANALAALNRYKTTFATDNLRMRTGIIVDFRTRDVLRDTAGHGTYPLFYAQHIKDGKVVWPIGKGGEYINTDRAGYLQENGNYLFVKRFTAKEEKRRLQCGIYLAEDFPQFKYISTQNKINFIKCGSTDEAYGLFVLFNSHLYDLYYRILNGSTQVNSTEINNMPAPPREIIAKMGRELQGQELTEENCNRIIRKWIRQQA